MAHSRTRAALVTAAAVGLLLCASLARSVRAQTAEGPAPTSVVLIGWDGALREDVNQLLDAGKLPCLKALAEAGTKVDIDVTTGATDTKAGWTQIFTGMTPEKTGVYSNARYQPIPEGYTIFERLEKRFGDADIYTGALIAKKGNIDTDPPRRITYDEWRRAQERQARRQGRAFRPRANLAPGARLRDGGTLVEENGTRYVQYPGKPWCGASRAMDHFENGLETNEAVGGKALAMLEERRADRFLLWFHFAYPDHAGHQFGEGSPEYMNGIIADDEWTGRIVEKLAALGIADRTLVYVTADHGFDKGLKSHRNAPRVFLVTNDKLVTHGGDRADIAPTILQRFGVDPGALDPPCDGTPLGGP